MAAANSQPFTHLADGTIVLLQPDGSYKPVPSETDQAWLDALSDAEIEEMAASDPDHPALDDEFWADADRQAADLATGTIKLDRDIFAYFSQQSRSYDTRINAVLRRYVAAQRQGFR